MTDQTNLRWHKWIFLVVFLYTLSLGLFIQLVFLPHLAPSMHMAEGVIKGNYDTYTFHTLANKLADLIAENGWSQWEWRVGSSGIASLTAIVYVFFGPHIWLMMPYNALVHALTAVVLFDLFRSMLPGISTRNCLLGTLPYVLFPSTLLWTAQLHKDGLFFLAIFMLFWVIVKTMQLDSGFRSWRQAIWIFLVCCTGQFFLWWFRQDRIVFFELFFGLCVFGVLISWIQKKRLVNTGAILRLALLALMMTSGFLYLQWDVRTTILTKEASEDRMEIRETHAEDFASWNRDHWEPANWLPVQIDSKLALLTEMRNNYFVIHWNANSSIDRDHEFKSVYDILGYIPRMLQISLFAPFPKDWLDEGSSSSATVMKRVVSLETILVYLSFIGFLGLLWKRRRNPYLWYLLLMVMVFMMIYAYVFPNLGTLYRQRFGFLAIITGLGLIGIASWFVKRSKETVSLRISRGEPESSAN